jgi:RNA polymerase sigma-70 factor, ECF subfamily
VGAQLDPLLDHRLMVRLAAGDEAAMDDLVARWQRPVLACVRRFLGCSPEEAQDLAQEAFLRVWRERARFQPRAAFSTWLFTIALNLCRNRRRTAGRRPAPVSIDELARNHEPEHTGEDPFARLRGAEVASRVGRALAALPPNQRAALLLKRFEDLSYKEIAAVLAVTPAAVESLLVRARRTLAAALQEPLPAAAQETEAHGVQR